DEGRELSAVIQEAFALIARFAAARVRLSPEVWIACHDMPAIGDGLHQHVWTCACGPGIERQIMLGHARLMIKAVCFPRYGRGERHGLPVSEQGVSANHLYALCVVVQCLSSVKTQLAQIPPLLAFGLGPRLACRFFFLQLFTVIAHA